LVQIKVASPTGLFYPAFRKSGGMASLVSAAIASSAPIVDCLFEPKRRTDTVFSLASLRPTAMIAGIFASERSRTL
jgi:hypothetical protein